MSKRDDLAPSFPNEKSLSPFSNSGSYTEKDSNYLVNAESSKKEVESLTRKEYPIYEKEHANKINELIQCDSSKVTEIVNTVVKIHENTWSLSECFSLLECVYDPRNYGRVVPKFDKGKDVKFDNSKKNIKKEDKNKKSKKEIFISFDTDILEF